MNAENKLEALRIISASSSIKVSFNVPVHDNYSNCYDILIHESNATVINDLIKAGFSLSMSPKGLSVNKY